MVWVTCLAGESLYIYKRLFTTYTLLFSTNLYGFWIKKLPGNVLHPLGMRSLQRGPGSLWSVTRGQFTLSDDSVDGSEIMVTMLLSPPNV